MYEIDSCTYIKRETVKHGEGKKSHFHLNPKLKDLVRMGGMSQEPALDECNLANLHIQLSKEFREQMNRLRGKIAFQVAVLRF